MEGELLVHPEVPGVLPQGRAMEANHNYIMV